jgi:hypothetical protein
MVGISEPNTKIIYPEENAEDNNQDEEEEEDDDDEDNLTPKTIWIII